MAYSGNGKYRGAPGNLSVSGGNILFTRTEGLLSKTQRIVVKIPVNAIQNINVEGMITKKLVILVDNSIVPGIPRHEFELSNPYDAMTAIQGEMNDEIAKASQPHEPVKEVYVKEVTSVIKVPCQFCGSLNEITEKKCSSCGADVGK